MNSSARTELASIKKELDSIIKELEDIRDGVKAEFTGIGNEKCAGCIDRVINQYKVVKRKLANLDTTTVTDSFAQFHGGGVR